jgi:putative SOS response-associated peptidase YedK
MNSHVGNLPSLPGIFPDYPAPIVRNSAGEREIVMARWGMPTSQFAHRPRSARQNWKPRASMSISMRCWDQSRTAV